jgi:hypothetical protein
MDKNFFAASLTFFSVLANAQNFIATYGFDDVTSNTGLTDPTPPPVVQNLVMGSFRASGQASNPGASGRFSFSAWPLGAVDASDDYWDFTGALSATSYYEVGLKIVQGHTLELRSIAFNVRRSGTGIRTYCVRSSKDGYTGNLAASTGTNTKLEVITGDVFLWKHDSISTSGDQRGSVLVLDSAYSHLTDTIAFRFYAWNSEATGGTFSIDNVTFSGYVKDSLFFAATTELGLYGPALFPNPVTGEWLNFSTPPGNVYQIIVADIAGRVALFTEMDSFQTRLNVSGLVPGCYLATFYGRDWRTRRKFFIAPK